MRQNIKESFDQIHAPKSLIEETKRKIHESEQIPIQKQKVSPYKRGVVGILVAAASIAIVYGGIHFANNNGDTHIPFNQNQVNVGNQDMIKGDSVRLVKSQEDWQAYIQSVMVTDNQEIVLKDDYTVYTLPAVKREDKEFIIEVQVKEGTLRCSNNTVELTGKFYCVVSEGSRIIKQTQLDMYASRQFVMESNEVHIETSIENDEVLLTLEDIQENGEAKNIQYIIDSDWNIEKLN